MGIEGQVKFLGRIPLTPRSEITKEYFPISSWSNFKYMLAGVIFYHRAPTVYGDETIGVIGDRVSIPIPKKHTIEVFSRDQINHGVSIPTPLPGVRRHLTYK